VIDLNARCSKSIPGSLTAVAAAVVSLWMVRPVSAQSFPDLGNSSSSKRPPAVAQATAPPVVIRPILMTRPADSDRTGYGTNFSSESANEQALHVIVGRSVFIDTKHRLARVYITNPDILDSYTASPNQVVVTAKKTGASTLILWDESGEAKTYLISSDLNVEMLRDSMKQAFPNENLKVEGNEGRVVLTGTVETAAVADAAVKLASLYSKDVSNSLLVNSAKIKQVRLEVKIVEVDRSKINQFGFNFFSAGGNNLASTTTSMYPSTMTVGGSGGSVVGGKSVTLGNPLNFSLYNSRLNIGATLQDLETMQVAQILAEPNITTLSGQKADFLAGGEFPFPMVQASTTGTPTIAIVFKPYGVKLEFTPNVNTDGTIELTVAPEVSALDYTNAVTIAGYTIPAISTRRAETQVVLKSGQTFAISGLLDRRTTDLYSKTPGVASVPILGQLFKSKAVTHSDTELLVIVTPVIVDPVGENIPVPAVAPDPKRIVPLMDTDKFDKELPPGAKK